MAPLTIAPASPDLPDAREITRRYLAGLRLGSDGTGEVVRVFVDAGHRRRGTALALMGELEAVARARGLARLRLDTRDDLTEARGLYVASGYAEVPPFSHGPYAERWFERAIPAS